MSSTEPLPVSHRLEYAVRSLVALARAKGPLTAEQIAVAEGIPRLYLLTILRELTTAGLLTSRRGRRGGFALAHEPGEITVAQVVAILDRQPESARVEIEWSTFPGLWTAAHDAAFDVLAAVSIADLAARRESTPTPAGATVRRQTRQ